MAAAAATPMDAIDIGEFLQSQATGVLSMARADRVYAVPVSFAYVEADSALYFRLGYGPDSQKRPFVEAGVDASFVVHDRTAEGWKSVVAEGQLEPLSETTLDTSVVQAMRALDIPVFGTHRRPPGELEFAIVRLDVSKLTGITETRRAGQPDGGARPDDAGP